MDEVFRVCMVSPEFSPFAKTGGPGDCVASRSEYTAKLGHEIKVILPESASLVLPEDVIEHLWPLAIHLGYGV